jgi:PAS domain S-box-containing protein
MTHLSPTLAELIVENLKGYAILTLEPNGAITSWLGDAEGVTGYAREEALSMNLADLFMESDRAVGAPTAEIEAALASGRAEDSRWHQHKNGTPFWANGLTIRLTQDRDTLVKIFRDETPAKQADEHRVLLLNELNHRVKNTLVTVQSVISQALRSAGVDAKIRSDITDRLIALARTHNVLVDENWAGADFRQLLMGVLSPHDRQPSPFTLEGPDLRLHPSQAVSIALALHELTTNAIKYGALSTGDGGVQVTWNTAHNGLGARFLTLLWREHGGPPVAIPSRTGFGSTLIRQTFANQDGAQARIEFKPEGIECSMVLRLADDGTTAGTTRAEDT